MKWLLIAPLMAGGCFLVAVGIVVGLLAERWL